MAAAVVDQRLSIRFGRDAFDGGYKTHDEGLSVVNEEDITIFRDRDIYPTVNNLSEVPKIYFLHRDGVSYFNGTNLFYYKIMNAAANIACYKQFMLGDSIVMIEERSKIYNVATQLINKSKKIFEAYKISQTKGKAVLISGYDDICVLLSAFEKEYISYLIKI